MSRRDTAVHYLLEHRLALLLAGFVLLLDQLAVDWVLAQHAGGAAAGSTLGPLRLGYIEAGLPGAVLLPLLLAVVGALGLWRRVTRLRREPQPGTGPASELLVLAGALTLLLSLVARGAVVTPLSLTALDWGLNPASVVALPAALVLVAESSRRRRGHGTNVETVG